MKHLFIVNPIAGGKDHTAEIKEKVESVFKRHGGEYEIYITKAPMDATEKIKQEAASGEQLRVYACGGDGTFGECACGAALKENVAVCPFPVGTGNDFCRMFGDEQHLYRDLDALVQGWETPIDLISCNGRYSTNICSVGIDARIGTSVHKYSKIPFFGGAAGYVLSSIVEMFKGIAENMKVRSKEFETEGKHTLICACNGSYYGGGFHPCPTARPDDGIMDVLVIKKVSLLTFAALIKKFAAGEADELKQYVTHLRTDELEIEFDKESIVNFDGEPMMSKLAHMKLVHNAMKLIVPRGMHFFDEVKSEENNAAIVQ